MPLVNDLPKQSAPYVELSYIQGQGEQWIDTGFYPRGNMEFEIKWNNLRTSVAGMTDMSIFGSRTNYNSNQYQLTDYTNSSWGVTGTFGNSTNSQKTFDLHYAGNTDIVTSVRGGVLTTGTGYTHNVGTDNWNRPYKMILFGSRNGSTTVAELATFRLYYMKIWFNGYLYRDYIPVRKTSNGEVCLFDKVGEIFYTNRGSGVFLGG